MTKTGVRVINKYKNKKTITFDGILHDSRKEANRWAELKLMLRAGEIDDLRRQVKFELIPAQYEVIERYSRNGKRLKDDRKLIEKPVYYIADFVYIDKRTNNEIVEDTKGVKTKDYVIKRKLMLFLKGIRVREI